MLSLFPSLLDWSLLAPFIIRLTLGLVFIISTLKTLRGHSATSLKKTTSVLEGIAAILLFAGLWTQGAALFLIIDLTVRLFGKVRAKQFLSDGVNYYLVLLVLAISLLLTGAGAFAFDYPL